MGDKVRNPIARRTKYLVVCPSRLRVLSAKSCSVEGAVSPWSVSGEVSHLLVSPRIVGTGMPPGRELDTSLDSLVRSRPMFSAESGGH